MVVVGWSVVHPSNIEIIYHKESNRVINLFMLCRMGREENWGRERQGKIRVRD